MLDVGQTSDRGDFIPTPYFSSTDRQCFLNWEFKIDVITTLLRELSTD